MEEAKWLLAFHYRDMKTAGEAYETCRDLVFGLDIDASAYRIQLNTVAHVVVVGEGRLHSPVRVTCSNGLALTESPPSYATTSPAFCSSAAP